jgi:hypothetical protein
VASRPGRPTLTEWGVADLADTTCLLATELLVDAVAASWGTRPAESGKTVWFTLPATPADGPGSVGFRQDGRRSHG